MMSAAQTRASRLEALQCHFTWDLDLSGSLLSRCRDKLLDIGTDNGNRWLGHIYNLRGFIQYRLGSNEDAQSFFNKATEAFNKMRNADEGPWLVVNYGNLAWLHHHLGDQAESEAYLSKVDALNEKYPSPPQEELHPEIYAEKAYTLMTFNGDMNLVADYFQRAIEMQPDMVEWNSWHVLGLTYVHKRSTGLDDDIFQKMRIAQEQDPENLNLAAHYLWQRAKRGESIEDEARELATKVLGSPVGSYSGLKPLLWVYGTYISDDEAIALAEEALKNHPDERYLKRRAALCYQKRLFFIDSPPATSMLDRAVSLHEEVIALYPDSPLIIKLHLATVYAHMSDDGQAKAEQIYQELLKSDLELEDKQLLYNYYAQYLHYQKQDGKMSIRYHMEAAKIQHQSFFRKSSIRILEKIRDRHRNSMCGEIREFLANLKEP
ncbi:interferon-induced protein with tetratricopeptide repeats 1-like [Pseudochaenichthys georgianus]|uniref:interferon-induced protein with tetratricopeptide repeats 1-like n=1 Tax=Pseudochaenichthys georgianus TaxID=52239 RepID=UPI00146AA861|nr:interferon-induced protein with tetratricopeptide repeats 1-like [Pseudochaenichthys georgianus]